MSCILLEAEYWYGHHIDSVKEILSEPSSLNFFLQVSVGCGDEPGINRDFLFPPTRGNFLVSMKSTVLPATEEAVPRSHSEAVFRLPLIPKYLVFEPLLR